MKTNLSLPEQDVFSDSFLNLSTWLRRSPVLKVFLLTSKTLSKDSMASWMASTITCLKWHSTLLERSNRLLRKVKKCSPKQKAYKLFNQGWHLLWDHPWFKQNQDAVRNIDTRKKGIRRRCCYCYIS